MAAYLITGLPGAGKTTIIQELQKRGYNAHETDENGMTSFYDLKTGRKLDKAPPAPIDFTRYAWSWDVAAIKRLIASTQGTPIFFGGIAGNTVDNLELFDKVFIPYPTLDTLKHRLKTRTNNDFGKHPDELADILKDHSGGDTWWAKQGAIILDGDQSVEKITDDILERVNAG
jgi:AAA domain-containing protein